MSSRTAFFQPIPRGLRQHGQDRHEDDPVHDQAEMFLHERQASEKIPGADQREYPAQRARDVEQQKAAPAHAGDPGDKGGEGADKGNETGQENGLSAVPFVELPGLMQIFAFQPTVVFAKNGRPDVFADTVVDRIAEDGGGKHGGADFGVAQHARSRQGSSGKKDGRKQVVLSV